MYYAIQIFRRCQIVSRQQIAKTIHFENKRLIFMTRLKRNQTCGPLTM